MKEIDVEKVIECLTELSSHVIKGQWWMDSHGEALISFTGDGIKTVLRPQHLREKAHRDEFTGGLSYWNNDSDASWIATAQPKNIMAVIEKLRSDMVHYRKCWKDAEFSLLEKEGTVQELVAENAALKAKLANPVVFPERKKASFYSDYQFSNKDLASVYNGAILEIKHKLHAAGFTVRGEQ